MDTLQRSEAKRLGHEFYFTGKSCKNGQVTKRRTSNGSCQCSVCQSKTATNEALRSRYQTDEAYRERKKQIAKRAREQNKERARKWALSYKERNRDAVNAAAKDWYNSKPENERKEYSRAKYYKSITRSLLSNAKSRASKHNIPFNITVDDIIVPDVCPVLGIPLVWGAGRGRMNDNSPSLDKIIPDRGYVRGNICVISWRANRLKNDASLRELQAICDYISRIL